MKKFLKWTFYIVVVLAVCGFLAFLYFIPPFFLVAPETFSKAQNDAAPPTTGIADLAERAIAEHGRYLVVTAGCIGCHQVPGPQGPQFDKYLAGGMKFKTHAGTFISRNLTPDKETGLARRTDDEVKRVLRSGVFPDGHVTSCPSDAVGHLHELDRRGSARGRGLSAAPAGRPARDSGSGRAGGVPRANCGRGSARRS